MTDLYAKRPIRIPVRYVDGKWELLYGGPIPVAADATATLIVDESAITEFGFFEQLNRKTVHKIKILSGDARLLVAVRVRPEANISRELQAHLIPFEKLPGYLSNDFRSGYDPTKVHFVQIKVLASKPIADKDAELSSDGVFLLVEGTKPKGVISSKIELPMDVSKDPVDSLNHAMTILSECYERLRKSHTGNVYRNILYQEQDGFWRPLDTLRTAAIAKLSLS